MNLAEPAEGAMTSFDIRQSSFISCGTSARPTLMTSQVFAVRPRTAAGWWRRRITAPLAFRLDLFYFFFFFCLRGGRGLRPVDWTTNHLWPLGVNQVVSS